MDQRVDPAHGQQECAVRFDWGPTGAAAICPGADVAVVVDVLSFTTTVTLAVARGGTVLPFGWRDERAAAYAEARGARLAVGRLEARQLAAENRPALSLSPSGMAALGSGEVGRVALPSPNGSSICSGLRDAGVTVVGACLRNRAAVADWLAPRLAAGQRVAVVAAGERWPDDSLRPAVEDLWGAGAVVAALADLGVRDLSPEAAVAADAFRAVKVDLGTALRDCASGRELVATDFAADVTIAAELDVDDVVPVLIDEEFAPAGQRRIPRAPGEFPA